MISIRLGLFTRHDVLTMVAKLTKLAKDLLQAFFVAIVVFAIIVNNYVNT